VGQVGEDAEGDGQRDGVGDAGEGEGRVLDQVVFGEARGVGEFGEAAVPHQGERGVGAPVVAGARKGTALWPSRSEPQPMSRRWSCGVMPWRPEGGHLDAPRLVPAAADDVAVAALAMASS
jgi:hypothetical protein